MCLECREKYPIEWLEATPPNELFTNEFVIHNRSASWEHWCNPYEEGELDKLRQNTNITGREWEEYVKEHFPGIDAKEQRRLKIEERDLVAMEECGTWEYVKDEHKLGRTKRRKWFCKRKNCPVCNARKKQGLAQNVKDTNGVAYKVTPEQAKQIKKDRTKDDYQQYNNEEDGEIWIILKKNDKPNVEVDGQDVTDKLADYLAECAVDKCTTKRVSGQLRVQKPEESENDEPELPSINMRRRVYKVEFREDSEIQNHKQLDELVIAAYEKRDFIQLTESGVNQVIRELENLTAKIAQEHCDNFHFVKTETIRVYLGKIDYWDVIKDPFEMPQ